ncbi:MAG: hypothetical protein AAF215_10960 [Cyanobacteria bacterium P01_A01_bin.123]
MPFQDIRFPNNVLLTRQLSARYLRDLTQVGADTYHAQIASAALARLFCESIPPNSLQQRSISCCEEAIWLAGLKVGELITLA